MDRSSVNRRERGDAPFDVGAEIGRTSRKQLREDERLIGFENRSQQSFLSLSVDERQGGRQVSGQGPVGG
jgi:hypothetical protein